MSTKRSIFFRAIPSNELDSWRDNFGTEWYQADKLKIYRVCAKKIHISLI